MANALKKIKEVRLIERIASRFRVRDKSVLVSIGDDAAVVRASRSKYLLYTCDMLVESVHFKKNEDYRKVGYKSVAVSVSDIAAMGGVPKYLLISVGLPKKNMDRNMDLLLTGIELCAKKFNIHVVGGDTNRSRHLVLDTFLVGEVSPDKLVLRSTAKAGDHIFVSGPLGGSLKGGHLTFTPRVREAQFLVKNLKVTSMIDLSDGLAMDLNRIASASRVGALIFEGSLPKSKGVFRTENVLYDGEDFELLFTLCPKEALQLFSRMTQRKTISQFYHIGWMTDSFVGVKMMTLGHRLKRVAWEGFRHF